MHFEEYIRMLAGTFDNIPDWPQKVDAVINDWNAYFIKYDISQSRQIAEIEAVIKLRVDADIISITAPTTQEFGLLYLTKEK